MTNGTFEALKRILSGKEDFKWSPGIEYDSETYHPCQNGSTCCDNDYCRCGKIQNARVTDFDINKFIHSFSNEEIPNYFLDRIFSIAKVDTNSFEVEVEGGYYGQETGAITLHCDFSLLNDRITPYTSDIELVKLALEFEYDSLLPIVKKSTSASIKEIDRSLIIAGSKSQIEMVKKTSYPERYKNYDYPIGVCVMNAKRKYRLIDGYHRYAASFEKKMVKVVVLS